MASNLLPQARLPISEDGTTFSLPWLRFFQGISSGSVDPAVIAALEAEIAAAEAAAATAQATANEALIIAEEAEAGISPAYGITFAALDEPSRFINPVTSNWRMMGLDGEDGQDGIGIPGPPGPAGSVSSRQFWQYRAKTTATSGYPGDGYMLWNNATQISASALIFSHLTQDDLDIDIFLSYIATGNTIIIQDANDSGNSQTWTVSSSPTNTNPGTLTSYWTVPVTLTSSAGTGTSGFPNNHSLIAAIFTPGGGGGITTSSTIYLMGQDGQDGGDNYFILPATGTSGGGGSLTVTDGTHTVSGTTQVTFSGATVGGSTPNATVTISGGGGIWTLTSTTTITAQTTVTALSALTGHTDYLIELYNVTPSAANTNIVLQFGNASGPTWVASTYYGGAVLGSNIGVQGPAYNPQTAVIIFGSMTLNTPPSPCYAWLTINNPASSTNLISVFGTVDYWASSSPNGVVGGTVVGRYLGGAGPFDSFRLQCASAFSGTMRIYTR